MAADCVGVPEATVAEGALASVKLQSIVATDCERIPVGTRDGDQVQHWLYQRSRVYSTLFLYDGFSVADSRITS